ncbi:MAG: class I SAM-dependent methyltransferase [Bacteroidota bacterium]
MDEIQRILEAYRKRDINRVDERQYRFTHYRRYTQLERERVYARVVRKYIADISSAKIMEVGAGDGTNLAYFRDLGFYEKNIYANELRPDKCAEIGSLLPASVVCAGNASELSFKDEFDICFQSTVFTSILSDKLKREVALKMFDMTRPGGIVLWYDFIYDNPWNKDVKGVKKAEVRKLFPGAKKITFWRVMLAPPLGRRVGVLYPVFNFLFPFLRSHIIAVIEKRAL